MKNSAHQLLLTAIEYYDNQRWTEAEAACRQSLQQQPNHPDGLHLLGLIACQQDDPIQGIAYYQQALKQNPQDTKILSNLGMAFKNQGNWEEAIAIYQQLLTLDPNHAKTHSNLGQIYKTQGKLETAVEHYHHALGLTPDDPSIYNNFGNALKEQGKTKEAIAAYQKALNLDPNYAKAYHNWGNTLQDVGKPQEAIAFYEKAIQLTPDYANAHLNLGLAWLQLGDLPRGFEEYYWRWKTEQASDLMHPHALWDGTDLQGKTLLLHAEQGFGDTIQFVRYVNLLGQYNGPVVLVCQQPLLKLLASIEGLDECFDRNEATVPFQVHAPLLELPRILGTTIETIPNHVPYLHPPEDYQLPVIVSQASSSTLKVGIVWAVNRTHSTAKQRSCPLSQFLSLCQVSGVEFYSLQKEIIPEEEELIESRDNIKDLSPFLQDFTDTAAIINHLDLVISVDTSVAHLAGALGKPVWVMLPKIADWRWLVEREDSPWYPTMHLFRQSQEGDWQEVLERIRKGLQDKLGVGGDRGDEGDKEDGGDRGDEGDEGDEGDREDEEDKGDEEKSITPYSQLAQVALSLYQHGNLSEAETVCHQVLGQKSDHGGILNLLGVIAYQTDRIEEAIAFYQRAVKRQPNNAEIQNNLAIALQNHGQKDQAKYHYQQALRLKSDYPEAWYNLGTLWEEEDNWQQALEHYQQAITLRPNYEDAHLRLGDAQIRLAHVLLSQDQLSLGLNYCQKGLKVHPNSASAHVIKALIHLKQGDLKLGFSEYQWRLSLSDSNYPNRGLSQPFWDGSNFVGKTLLIYTEQGLGDTLQFIRYFPWVQARGGKIVIECNKQSLQKFLGYNLSGVEQILVKGDPLPNFNLQIPLMSIPHLFGTILGTIPVSIPYLFVPNSVDWKIPQKHEQEASKVRQPFKVGIVWESKSQNKTSQERSCPLNLFQNLFSVSGINFYSLQQEISAANLISLKQYPQVYDLSNDLRELEDTAKAITQLDLVITIDTMVAHLAGALGKPVWVMLPKIADWRWLVEREDSPWYPTMHLFRQSQEGDWQEVLERIRKGLQDKLGVGEDEGVGGDKEDEGDEGDEGDRGDRGDKEDEGDGGDEGDKGDEEKSITPYSQLAQVALSLYQHGNLSEAETVCHQVLGQKSDHGGILNLLGVIAYQTDRIEEAIAFYQRAVKRQPNNAEIQNNLAIALQNHSQKDQAKYHYQQALRLKSDYPEAWYNLGTLWEEEDNWQQALEHYQQAITLRPNYEDAHLRLGHLFLSQDQLSLALNHCQNILAIAPNSIRARVIRAFIQLKQGNLRQGFAEYEGRLHHPDYPKRGLSQPLWDGSNFFGKTLLIHTEQGLGDGIQFIRYLPLVKEKGEQIIVECNQKALQRLFATIPEITKIIVKGDSLPNFDLQVSLMSLPHLLGTTLETIPASIPYLSIPNSVQWKLPHGQSKRTGKGRKKKRKIKGQHSLQPHHLKVGIVWETNPLHKTSQARSCPLNTFQSLFSLPGINFYSLQKDISSADLTYLNQYPQVYDLSNDLGDLGDTAGAIAQLDLVITVDTVVAHLAGALGKTVWVMLPCHAEWRWLLEREDSPWYPTMHLFRQSQEGNWQELLTRIKTALKTYQTSKLEPRKSKKKSLAKPKNNLEILTKLSGGTQLKQCRYGIFLYNLNDSEIGDHLDRYGEWKEAEISLFQQLLRPQDIVIEIGANLGAHTLFFAQTVGEKGQVFAFEPQRLVFQTLCGNLALNQVTNTYCYNLSLEIAVESSSSPQPETTRPVNILDDFAFPHCRLIKIDAKGKELTILKGATQTLEKCQPALYLETENSKKSAKLIHHLQSIGYDLYHHCPSLYNPHNYFQNQENRFPNQVSQNILGLPRQHIAQVQGLTKI